MMDPVFAMDETFSLASGSRLVRRCDLTSVMQREHADGQRNFACQAHFLPHLGRCRVQPRKLRWDDRSDGQFRSSFGFHQMEFLAIRPTHVQ